MSARACKGDWRREGRRAGRERVAQMACRRVVGTCMAGTGREREGGDEEPEAGTAEWKAVHEDVWPCVGFGGAWQEEWQGEMASGWEERLQLWSGTLEGGLLAERESTARDTASVEDGGRRPTTSGGGF